MGLGMQYLDNYLPVLFAMTFLLDAAQAVAGPTWQALLPRIVGEERTPRAMGTMQATIMIAGMAGTGRGRAAQRLGRGRAGVCRGERLLPRHGAGRRADPDPPRHRGRAGRPGQARTAGRAAPDPPGQPRLGPGARRNVLHHRWRGHERSRGVPGPRRARRHRNAVRAADRSVRPRHGGGGVRWPADQGAGGAAARAAGLDGRGLGVPDHHGAWCRPWSCSSWPTRRWEPPAAS